MFNPHVGNASVSAQGVMVYEKHAKLKIMAHKRKESLDLINKDFHAFM